MDEPEHLGGWEYNGNSDVPWLWDWLIEKFHPRSMLDVGCGLGLAAAHFLKRGVDAYGMDGSHLARDESKLPRERFIVHDFAAEHDGMILPMSNFDMIWCCEFVEHVEERFADNFLALFGFAPVVAMTHALPHQTAGHHHVNLKDPGYWVEKVESLGFHLDVALTNESKELRPDLTECYWNWSGLIFRR